MASVSTDPRGNRRVQFTGPDRRRRTIRLGKVSKRAAEDLAGLVERANAAALIGHGPADADARRIADLPDTAHARLAAVGLVPPRRPAAAAAPGPFLAAYLADRSDAKPNTLRHLGDAAEHLTGFLGAGKPLADVTPGDADEFRRHLAAGGRGGRGPNTVARMMGRANQFFRHARREGLIGSNPFEGQPTAVRANPSRAAFVSAADAARVLDACPDAGWRLVFALARWGGLRCPSEFRPLTWESIHWPDPDAADPRDRAGWVRILSPKTEHHPGGAERVIPLFAELLPHLVDLAGRRERGGDAVLPRFQRPPGAKPYNPHTYMKRIVRKAGVEPWPKLFQNFRSTRQMELAAEHPAHVVCGWMGNSRDVAAEHYLHTTAADFARAVGGEDGEGGATNGARPAQKAARHAAAHSGTGRPRKGDKPTPVGSMPFDAADGRSRPLSKLPRRGLEPPRDLTPTRPST